MNAKFLKTGTFLFYLILTGILAGFPQTLPGSGFKYFKNYSPDDYNNQPQNWAVLQDKRGIIYMANQGGLMEFDGVSWRMLLVPNRVVRSMVMDDTSPNGTIYIGGKNEIGFAAPDNTGKLQYVSLRHRLPQDTPNFADVYATLRVSKKIYFQSAKFLFRWDPYTRQMKPLEIEAIGTNSFACAGKLYIYQANSGLSTIENDSIKPCPGVTAFDSRICMVCPFDARRILIGTTSSGLFLYNGVSTEPFPTGADELLKKQNGLFTGIRLSSAPGQFALGTSGDGLIIIDSRGKVTYTFDKSSGLPVDSIFDIFEDPGGNLWLSLEKGLSKIEYASPFHIYDARKGLSGIGLSLMKHSGVQFAGTTDGLFYLTASGKFRPVPGISKNFECWSLLSTGDSLLAGLTDGTYRVEVQNNGLSIQAQKVIDRFTYVLCPSRVDPNRVRAGSRGELISLYRVNKTAPWKTENIIPIKGQEIKSMVEDVNGHLWIGTVFDGVLRFDFSEDNQLINRIHFTQSHGLPPGGVYVAFAAGHVLFLTQIGLARFDEKENRFYPDNTLGNDFSMSGTKPVFRLLEDTHRNTWFHSTSLNYHALLKPDGTYHIISRPFLRIPISQVNCIYFDPGEDSAWFANMDGLIRYDIDTKTNSHTVFNTLIRKVELINGKIPVFNGFKEDQDPGLLRREFEYKDRNIRFEFASPFFEDEKQTTYAYRLEGYDDDWAPFSSETQKDYTNLGPGTYTFRARAQNVYGDLSKEAFYRFKILPPWYQTWWAFLIYGLTALLLMHLVVKWRSRRLVQEKQKLEHIIKERTEQINRQKMQLLEQAEKLKEMDKVKSRFFANISHEFRTPLTLIMGPLEKRLAMCRDEEDIQELQMMLRNSGRLLNLVNQLLELARLESGKMKLEASPQNIAAFVKSIVMCFESLAVREQVELNVNQEEDEIPVYFDAEKLEKIITNLLSNAFKYTPAGGEITVLIRRLAGNDRFSDGCVEISVRDTGTGIPADQLPHIFDRFYRGEGGHEYKGKGAGIGLALTKELVELHHGEIEAQSSCLDDDSRGSEFFLRLPMGENHLQPEEIVEVAHELHELPRNGATPNEKLLRGVQGAPRRGEPIRDVIDHEDDFHSTTYTRNRHLPPLAEKSPPGRRGQEIILVVEDNADVRAYIKSSLGPYFTVIEAGGGKEGILRAKEFIPDLIVSDVMMPVTDGFELCRTLKKDVLTCHIPIILLTAKVSEESVLEGLETGADDYITKPFSSRLLAVRIRNLMELRRQLQLEKKNRMTHQPEEITVSPLDDEFYKKLLETLETRLSDPEFNVEALGRTLQMSHATLYRKIQALTGKSPTLFIRSYRIKRAAQLLSAPGGNVSAAAEKVGFADKSYFAKCFKEQFDCLPSDIQACGTGNGNGEEEPLPGAEPAGFAAAAEDTKPGKEIVLVVEDNDDARHYIRESLEPGYRVVEAGGGGEGLARAMEIIPDLVISDIMMPGMDGFELCRLLKKDVRTSHIPLVLLTARAAEASIIRGLESGADDYIIKPFNTDILRVRVKNLIRLRSHLQKGRNREMALLPAKIKESHLHREFEKELNAAIEKNLEDPEFNVDRLAKILYMSSATLYRKIQSISGEVPSEYIRSFRLKRAAELLKSNVGSVTQVAFEVGFNSRTYFTRCFKEKFHQLPSVYTAAE